MTPRCHAQQTYATATEPSGMRFIDEEELLQIRCVSFQFLCLSVIYLLTSICFQNIFLITRLLARATFASETKKIVCRELKWFWKISFVSRSSKLISPLFWQAKETSRETLSLYQCFLGCLVLRYILLFRNKNMLANFICLLLWCINAVHTNSRQIKLTTNNWVVRVILTKVGVFTGICPINTATINTLKLATAFKV